MQGADGLAQARAVYTRDLRGLFYLPCVRNLQGSPAVRKGSFWSGVGL